MDNRHGNVRGWRLFSKMKQCKIDTHEIRGVFSALPDNKVSNDFFEDFLTAKEIKSITKMTGVKERYWSKNESTADL